MKKINFCAWLIFIGLSLTAQEYGDFTDARDGRVYKTIQIGSQVWMAENLNFTAEGDGVIYPNNPSLAEAYGRIYCWEVALEVCPDGWHLPSDSEWTALTETLGGIDIAGDKMKLPGKLWLTLNEGANNESGFSAVPGGYQKYPDLSNYHFMGYLAHFWSSTEKTASSAIGRGLDFGGSDLSIGHFYKNWGMSVRCVKDE
ncbi:MAG: FISUMP domain-containing protein [Bacteroidales bacterium]|nr:FISUMP domain-containing protein [Bacteroidales bacterium]